MTKHTPGPESLDTIIASRARARHIAEHAPELLEALAAIVDRLSAWEEGARISGDDNARVNYSLLCGTAYAAIAKATGATD